MLTSAGKEWLKWLALVAMTADHVDKVIFAGQLPALSAFGRLAFPIFAVVLVGNLQGRQRQALDRAFSRLLVAGLLVQWPYMVAFDRMLPLNTLWTLAAGVWLLGDRPRWAVALVFLLGGFVLDYSWPGLLVMAAAAFWCRSGGTLAGWAVLAAAIATLAWLNGNHWALATLPLFWLATRTPGALPRWRWLFLGYYVAHIAVLALWRIL